jgi:hypothetical protein
MSQRDAMERGRGTLLASCVQNSEPSVVTCVPCGHTAVLSID